MLTIKLPNDKVNFTWSTDWHLAAIPPGRRRDDYQAALLGKLAFIGDLTNRLRGAALCGGDVFHVKNAKSESNGVTITSGAILTIRTGFPLQCVFGGVGNHDISFDRMDTLPKQPLNLLISAGVYHNLNEESVLFTNQNCTVTVLVETLPYDHDPLPKLRAVGPRPQVEVDGKLITPTYRIGIMHAYGEEGDGGTLYGEPKIGYNQIADLDFDFMCWGHDHSRKETVQVGNITHVNLGSLARAALAEDEVDRPVVCAIISFAEDGVRYKEKEIPVKPLEVAFLTADKPIEQVAKSDDVREFFAKMDDEVEGIESTDPREILVSLCPEEDKPILSLVQELCEL